MLGFHSMLAYLGSHTATHHRFDTPPYDWQAFPIIDSARWFGFDLFCAWNDVCLMSLMFFLSGLFVLAKPGSASRAGNSCRTDCCGSVCRWCLPMYLVDADRALSGVSRHGRRSEHRGVLAPVPGPALLAVRATMVSLAAAGRSTSSPPEFTKSRRAGANSRQHRLLGTHPSAPVRSRADGRLGRRLRPARADLLALDLVPVGPIAFPNCRPLHNAVYFFAGVAVGAYGIERGLVAPDGVLARRWTVALAGASRGLPRLDHSDRGDHGLGNVRAALASGRGQFGFVVCCAGGCLAALAACVRFATRRSRVLDSLSANAYGMYLGPLSICRVDAICAIGFRAPAIVKARWCLRSRLVELGGHRCHAQRTARVPSHRRQPASACKSSLSGCVGLSIEIMSLAPKLAFRNLIHDRLRLVATVIGIVFSIVLVTVQAGLYLSFERMVTVMIDHASADLWIVPRGTKCFEDPSLLDDRERFRALAVEGVASATPLVIGFAQWKTSLGGTTPVFVIGSDPRDDGLHPWDVIEGARAIASAPRYSRCRPLLFRPSGDHRLRRQCRDRRPQGADHSGHQRHSLVHHHALRFHRARSCTHLYRNRGEQGLVFPHQAFTGRRRRNTRQPSARGGCPMPRC